MSTTLDLRFKVVNHLNIYVREEYDSSHTANSDNDTSDESDTNDSVQIRCGIWKYHKQQTQKNIKN